MDMQLADVMLNKGRAIPGQSLTTDPDNPAPYEKPPKFTSIHEASEAIFGKLIEEDNYMQFMQLLADDVPIMDLVQTVLFAGFTEGKWNTDLMMLLFEPVAYMFLALAERAGIDPVIYRGEEDDEVEEQRVLGIEVEREKIERMKKYSEGDTSQVPKGAISPKIEKKLESLDLPKASETSLLSPPEPQIEEE